MAGDRREELMEVLPDLKDQSHENAVKFCRKKAEECQKLADELNYDDESIFINDEDINLSDLTNSVEDDEDLSISPSGENSNDEINNNTI